MSPLLELLIQQLIIHAPDLAIEIIQLLSKPDLTDADWEVVKAKARKTMADRYAAAQVAALKPIP